MVQILALSTKNLFRARTELTATSRESRDLGPSIAKAAREVRISPDTGDGGRQAGEGNRDGGGETEDPAGEGARASHPAGGIGEAEGMAEARRG